MADNLNAGLLEWPRGEALLLLIFDGHCGVCARCADWVEQHDGARRVWLLPSQTPGLLAAFNLTRAQVDREAVALDRDGHAYAGAAAINRALRAIGGRWALLAGVYAIPGVRWCEDVGYRWFARHRGRFSRWGLTPWCERPGVRCGPDEA